MRTLARAGLALLVASGAACVTDRPVTWEDLGFSRADEPRREEPKGEVANGEVARGEPDAQSEKPVAEGPVAARAHADKPVAEGPIAEKPIAEKTIAEKSALASVVVDLTPRGRVALPGMAGASAEDGALIDVEALSLVCVADARALTETAAVFARLDEEALKVGATLGGMRLIRLSRDPARSLTDPPPRACRGLTNDAALKAPLAREREPKSTWLVTSSTRSIVDDSARASGRVNAGAHAVTASPRVIVDERGVMTALAIPVAPARGDP